MNKKLIPYVDLIKNFNEHNDIFSLIKMLKEKGASYAITMRAMEEVGYDIDYIATKIQESTVWDKETRSLTDLFYDFVELDNDLIE